MADDYNFDTEKIFETLLNMGKKVLPAAEELRAKLNEIISSQNLDANAAINLLAYVSAGYIHQVKQRFDTPEAKDMVEDLFLQDFEHYLGMHDLHSVNEELEKMKNKELN